MPRGVQSHQAGLQNSNSFKLKEEKYIILVFICMEHLSQLHPSLSVPHFVSFPCHGNYCFLGSARGAKPVRRQRQTQVSPPSCPPFFFCHIFTDRNEGCISSMYLPQDVFSHHHLKFHADYPSGTMRIRGDKILCFCCIILGGPQRPSHALIKLPGGAVCS